MKNEKTYIEENEILYEVGRFDDLISSEKKKPNKHDVRCIQNKLYIPRHIYRCNKFLWFGTYEIFWVKIDYIQKIIANHQIWKNTIDNHEVELTNVCEKVRNLEKKIEDIEEKEKLIK